MAYSKKCHKKLTKKAKDRHCCHLFPWIQSLSNHLWWSAQSCKGDAQVLVEKWKSIVHHISNVHEWDNDTKALFPKYVHQTLSPEEQHSNKWLKSGSVAHNALKKIVLQDTLLWDIKNLMVFIILAHWKFSIPCCYNTALNGSISGMMECELMLNLPF